ncbi:MAG TPA: UDP-N-acetylmuramoyl-L-alanine--D-glutamate ligase [Bryobacteraceae bacterium]|nr:UDP-N-acetylmuramoyl-L-alanine--D-glutamate ligase [Bryobacteraceae bacterium]
MRCTLVVGMKKSGMAALELLSRHYAQHSNDFAMLRATDLKPLDELPEARALLERLHVPFTQQAPDVFQGCDTIVLSPDVPADLPPLEEARRRGALVIGEVELAAAFLRGKTIGVTGSNGKTTTTSLIGHILRESGVTVQVGGNIGTPVTAMVDSSREEGWNVLELSSFQLETICDFHAHIGLALNVTQNHLDRHHTFENYAAAKGRLFETQRVGDFAVLNADDPVCVSYADRTAATVNWFSGSHKVTPGASLCADKLILDGKLLMEAGEIPIRGRHNVENVLAAAIAAARAGVAREQIAAAVRTFRAVEHRLEFVRKLNGIDFYNDSKATSVDATLKAVNAFESGLWVILGGKDKGLDYQALRDPLSAKAHAVLLIGAAAQKIAGQLEGSVPLVDAKTLDAAVAHAFRNASPGDTVLLAPACASFDQFKSYEHRGEVFKQIVNQLESKD